MDKNKMAVALFNNYAKRYQQKYMDQDHYQESLNFFCESVLNTNAKVLELGCGPGNVTRYLLQKRPDFRMLATDLAPQMLELAQSNNPGVEHQLLDGRKIAELPERFDAVVAAFLFPYFNLQETDQFIQDVSGLLEPKGLLFISTMSGPPGLSDWYGPSSGGPDRIYIHYHDERTLIDQLEASAFRLIHKSRLPIDSVKGKEAYDLLLVAKYSPKLPNA